MAPEGGKLTRSLQFLHYLYLLVDTSQDGNSASKVLRVLLIVSYTIYILLLLGNKGGTRHLKCVSCTLH